MSLTRRHLILTASACAVVSQRLAAAEAREIMWEDLIPAGVAYSEIIGEGYMDERNDVWRPVYDENSTKLNPDLNGAHIRMPGFIIPLESSSAGVTDFVLVPYVGACLHTPPPPANQLVITTSKTPWPNTDLWAAVWVTGRIEHDIQSTELGEIGYKLTAEKIEIYEW